MEPCNRCAIGSCKGVAVPSATIHLCDLCAIKHADLICHCRKDYVYLCGLCGGCWVKAQRKSMPSLTKKKRSVDTVAKTHSQPKEEPKKRRVEAVIDISDDDVVEEDVKPRRPPIAPITLEQMFPDIAHLMREYARRFPVTGASVPCLEELEKVRCKHEGCKQAMHKDRDFCEDHCDARDYLDEEAAEEEEYLAKEAEERNRLEAELDEPAEPKKNSV